METSGGLAGGLTAGDLWLGSATLTLQWRPGLMGPWHPYFGGGISFGEPFGFDLDEEAAAIGLVDIEFDGDLGYVLQAGVMYDLDRTWFLDLRVGLLHHACRCHPHGRPRPALRHRRDGRRPLAGGPGRRNALLAGSTVARRGASYRTRTVAAPDLDRGASTWETCVLVRAQPAWSDGEEGLNTSPTRSRNGYGYVWTALGLPPNLTHP